MSVTRDRAYIRYIFVLVDEKDRFNEFLKTLPAGRFVDAKICISSNHLRYAVKLKRQELMYVKLAFKVDIVRSRRIKTPTISNMLKMMKK